MDATEMRARILERFPDADVEVTDMKGTGDHWQVYVASTHFKGMNRIQQQQAIMNLFTAELKTEEVHALTMRTVVK